MGSIEVDDEAAGGASAAGSGASSSSESEQPPCASAATERARPRYAGETMALRTSAVACLPSYSAGGHASHALMQFDFMKPGFFEHSPPLAQPSQPLELQRFVRLSSQALQ